MDYAQKAIDVQTSIHANGGIVQLNKGSIPVYDAVARSRAPVVPPVSSNVFALVTTSDKSAANTFLQGTTQYSRMRDLLIAALDLPNGIDIGRDTFVFENNTTWRIITFDVLAPDNVTQILYTITVGA